MENCIEYSDFIKIELRVAQIIEAEAVEGTDKLVRLVVDLGNEKRQIIAGIRTQYRAEDLLHKKIAMVYNLKPRTLRGLDSEGMLLAASNEDHSVISLLTVDKDIPNGSRIR